MLLPIVEETQKLHPAVIRHCEELSADKEYDVYDIDPIIDKRSDWKDKTDATRPLFPERADTVVYDVKGNISCVCPVTGEQALWKVGVLRKIG